MALCLARGAGRLGSCFASGDDVGKLYSESSATTVGKRQGRWRMTGGVRAAALVHEAPPLATLGLRANATTSEIKSAYRKLAKLYHPDVCRGDECQTKFIQISNAYEDALKCLSIYGSDYRTSDIGENFADELEDWEEWMGWEGAGTLDF